jgi:transposase
MIGLPPGTKVFLACQPIDLRAGFDGLAAKVQQIIGADPFSGHVFIFRSKRGHYLKGLYWDGSGLCLPSVLSATNSCGRRSSTAR